VSTVSVSEAGYSRNSSCTQN